MRLYGELLTTAQMLLIKRTAFPVRSMYTPRKQLDSYLACTAGSLNILTPYPVVSSLSLKLNTAPPTFAAFQRLLSAVGLIFSPRRGRIDSYNFEKAAST